MYQGPAERKIEIMHDPQTGAGGFTLGLVTILTTALCIAQLNQNRFIQSLIVSEVSAKLAMVIVAWTGKSAHKGMNTYFVNAMHGHYRNLRIIVALFIAFGIVVPLMNAAGFAALVTGLAIALVLTVISNRHFRGVTGDVFGATNELARLASLITMLVVVRWA
jgi:adenosylcobinamide-GDP ribazoletransferase